MMNNKMKPYTKATKMAKGGAVKAKPATGAKAKPKSTKR